MALGENAGGAGRQPEKKEFETMRSRRARNSQNVHFRRAENASDIGLQADAEPQAALFDTGCCPRFNPKPWQGKTHKWKNKLFVKDRLRCFLHIPLGMNKAMFRIMGLINKAGAKNPESIMLFDSNSLWSTDIYIAVDRKVPGAQMATISGTFLSRVYEGGYSESGKWAAEMASYVKSKGFALKKLYFSYTTCPACAKAYGKNYVVLFAKV